MLSIKLSTDEGRCPDTAASCKYSPLNGDMMKHMLLRVKNYISVV
jgi:hypothetical protein